MVYYLGDWNNFFCVYFWVGVGVVSECGDLSDDSGHLSPLGQVSLPEVQEDDFLEA